MRILVESLKRLYENDRVTKTQLQKRVEKGIISIDEYNYIVGEEVEETEKTEPEQSEE
nr:MAG TPA: hypothetical protein [Caudoviricetes sp.]